MLFVGDEAENLFFTTPYDGFPLVMVRLDQVDAELVTDAWRMRGD